VKNHIFHHRKLRSEWQRALRYSPSLSPFCKDGTGKCDRVCDLFRGAN